MVSGHATHATNDHIHDEPYIWQRSLNIKQNLKFPGPFDVTVLMNPEHTCYTRVDSDLDVLKPPASPAVQKKGAITHSTYA